MVKSTDYEPQIQIHYNIHFKDGRLVNKVTQRTICGLRPKDIDWIWIVEERRRATPIEVRGLCSIVQEITS